MTGMMGFNSGYLAAQTPNGFGFTTDASGKITGMERLLGTDTFDLRLPGNATFAKANNIVTETLTGSYATEVLQYAPDPTNASLYHLSSDTMTIANPSTTNAYGFTRAYSFTIANGAVTGMQSVWGNAGHTYTNSLRQLPTAHLSSSGNTVTETLVQGNVVETLQFVSSGSAGLYALASDARSFVQPGSATTLLSVDPYDRAKFTIDAGGKVSQVQDVRIDGSTVTVTPNAYASFSQLAPGYVLETVSFGTRSSYEVYHDGNGDGIYTGIAHGVGTTVDLVGLQSQLSPAIHAVL
ncbi:MAG: hypothetical protein NT159_12650 [Proteobacteria bacterium]|nr:hypothetical protein [Pseudomonadota bacterium]